MSSFPFVMYCELSGEPLSTNSLYGAGGDGNDAIVVTPSGHVCRKRLLLTKLLENGGKDPFVADKDRPLQEDDLITLQQPSSIAAATAASNIMPPKSHPLGEKSNNNNTSSSLLSFSSTLLRLQTEYDAVLLELFDTRQALTETRRELSQALYQNDAAVRVVARVTAERDAARQAQITGQQQQQQQYEQEEQVTKKRKIETTTATSLAATTATAATGEQDILWNDISPTDMESMQAAWEGLHKNRKSWQKQAASKAPSKTDLVEAFHATTLTNVLGGGILAMTAAAAAASAAADSKKKKNNDNERIIVTMNDTHQVHLYSVTHQKVVAELETSNSSSRPTAMDHYMDSDETSATSSKVCLAFANGMVQVFMIPTDYNSNDKKKKKKATSVVVTAFGTCEIPTNNGQKEKRVVDVRFHPDGQHIVAALECGMVALLRHSSHDDDDDNNNANKKKKLVVVSMFDSKNYNNNNKNGDADADADDSSTKITCACLHPDGLIYLVGCSTGEIYLWDFRSKTLLAKPLAITEEVGNNAAAAVPVQQVIMSPNGYHIAALYYGNDNNNNKNQKDNGIVRIWDLRKQTCLATLNAAPPSPQKNDDDNDDWLPARCVTFDVSGKYIAYGVSSSSSDKDKKNNKDSSASAAIHVVTVKEWNQIAACWKLDNKNDNFKLSSPMTGLIWTSPEWLATCSSNSSGNNLLLIGKNSGKDETMKE